MANRKSRDNESNAFCRSPSIKRLLLNLGFLDVILVMEKCRMSWIDLFGTNLSWFGLMMDRRGF